MCFAGRSQRSVYGAARFERAFPVEFDRQHFAQRAVAVTAGVERARASEHR